MIDYAKKITENREKMFLTQADFANKLSVSLPCVTRWENGKFEQTEIIKKKLYQHFIEAERKVEE